MDLLRKLEMPGTVLLDSSSGGSAKSYLFVEPEFVLTAKRASEIPSLLRSLDDALSQGLHAAGYLGYESGYGLEPHRFTDQQDVDQQQRLGYPLAWFGLYAFREIVDGNALDRVFAAVDTSNVKVTLKLNEARSVYESKIERIKKLIHDGDVYQINYTGRFEGRTDVEAPVLYALMRRRQAVAFGAFIQLGDVQLLSASPEQFIEWSGTNISARPMKGTAPRGATPQCDELLGTWLKSDPKSRAENLMIVDLLRNDLSLVSEPGSVKVPSLFELETYSTVLQMTSTVTGCLDPECKSSEILSALFPCGSVTGAPKIRAMRRILELEDDPRGVYCGAIGCLQPGGGGAFNVAIRTLSCRDGAVVLGSGGGIVWESKPSEEYEECLLKGRFLMSSGIEAGIPIELIETMRWERGIPLLDHHLARLERSAAILGYPFPAGEIVKRLDELDASLEAIVAIDADDADDAGLGDFMDRAVKIRLLLGPAGSIRLESEELDSSHPGSYRVGISTTRVSSENPFLRIKSTFRGVYDAGRVEAVERGLDELLYLNENGELTEGTITNVFLRLDGKWFTPPLSSGVLSGVGRALAQKSALAPIERILTESDLRHAERILLTNAVRGQIEGIFVDDIGPLSGTSQDEQPG